MTTPEDALATRLFTTAMQKGQAGELLTCLFEGGSATVDPEGNLVFASADMLQQMVDNGAEDHEDDGPVPEPMEGGGFAYEMQIGSQGTRWEAPTALGLARICPAFSDADIKRLAADEEALDPKGEKVSLADLVALSKTDVPTWAQTTVNGGWSRIDLPGGRRPEEMLGLIVTITHTEPKEMRS